MTTLSTPRSPSSSSASEAASAGPGGRWRGALDGTAPLRRLELVVASAVLLLVGAAVYGPHVLGGGFLADDWSNAAKTRFLAACCGVGQTGQGSGYLAQVRNLLSDGPAGYHIGLPLLIPFSFRAFRPYIAPHLGLALLLAVAVSAAMYAVLRRFGVAPLHALLMAVLVLVFPWSDSNRLWAMASYNQLAVVLWLVGLLVALRGLRGSGLRALLWHTVALVLYAAGIMIYELVAGAVLVSVVFYWHRTRSGGVAWRGMAWRWAADVAVIAASLLTVLALALPRPIIGWPERFAFAAVVLDESVTLLAYSAFPLAEPSRFVVVGVLAAVLAAGLVVRARTPRTDPRRHALGQWLLVAAAGVVVVGGGYALAIPGGYGRPLSAGIENRVNLVSSAGYVMVVYAVAALAGLLLASAARRPRSAAAAAVPVAAALVALGGYAGLARESADAYDRSWGEQLRVLHAIRDGGPYPDFAHVFVFAYPSFTAPGVPVFSWIWDLPPASKVILDDPSPAAFPVLPPTVFTCEDASVLPGNGHGLGELQRSAYGNVFFVDVATNRTLRIDDRAGCEAALATMRPGPLMEGRDCALAAGGLATRVDWVCADGPVPLMRP